MKQAILFRALTGSMLAAALALGGCSASDEGASAPAQASSESAAAADTGGTVRLAYVEWDSCLAGTNLVKAALEKAGFTVKALSVSGAMMYQGLAIGDADATVCAWLPTTHKDYYAKTQDSLENLGANMEGTRIGLVVPAYVEIDSIPQLADHAERFDDRIVGIDPGAGVMQITQQAIDEYALPEKLISGSDATMSAVLADSIRKGDWVAVTGWTPHWMWARWDLKYLDDPKGVYGEPENIDTLVRKGLAKDMPRAYAILSNFQRTSDITGEVMAADRAEGADPEANARKWLDEHPDELARWLAETP